MYTDEELIDGCKHNKRLLQKALYNTYAPRLFAVCLRYAESTQEAEDIMQDAMLKVFKQIGKFRGESHLFYWLKRIVINTALNAQRGKSYMYALNDHDERMESSRWDAVSEYHAEELIVMIQELPPGCRTIFNLFAIEGFKHHEIAEKLNISQGTSKSQFARAKELLQKKLRIEEIKSHG